MTPLEIVLIVLLIVALIHRPLFLLQGCKGENLVNTTDGEQG